MSLTPGSGTLWPDRADDPPIRLEPNGKVTGLFCLTGDGRRILAPCGDRYLVCWSAADGKRMFAFDNGLQTLLSGRTRIHRAHPVGEKLIVATNSGQIVSVDPQSGALRRILLSIDLIPLTVHALPDRQRLFIGTNDGHVIVADWDGNVLSRWEHADGRIAATVASSDGRWLLVAATAGLMTLYTHDAGQWRPVLTFPEATEPIRFATLSPDGRYVVFQRERDAAPCVLDLERFDAELQQLGIRGLQADE